jgi:hypothetical protein
LERKRKSKLRPALRRHNVVEIVRKIKKTRSTKKQSQQHKPQRNPLRRLRTKALLWR